MADRRDHIWQEDAFLGKDGRYYILEYWPDGSWDVFEVKQMVCVRQQRDQYWPTLGSPWPAWYTKRSR